MAQTPQRRRENLPMPSQAVVCNLSSRQYTATSKIEASFEQCLRCQTWGAQLLDRQCFSCLQYLLVAMNPCPISLPERSTQLIFDCSDSGGSNGHSLRKWCCLALPA